MRTTFRDRNEAGRSWRIGYAPTSGNRTRLVLALPRGGVPVGFEIASKLALPLDVFVVRKLGVPGQQGTRDGRDRFGRRSGLERRRASRHAARRRHGRGGDDEGAREVERRERDYRQDRPEAELDGRMFILVDDGLATGATMLAAIAAFRQKNPAKIVVAVTGLSAEGKTGNRTRGGRNGDPVMPRLFPRRRAVLRGFRATQ